MALVWEMYGSDYGIYVKWYGITMGFYTPYLNRIYGNCRKLVKIHIIPIQMGFVWHGHSIPISWPSFWWNMGELWELIWSCYGRSTSHTRAIYMGIVGNWSKPISFPSRWDLYGMTIVIPYLGQVAGEIWGNYGNWYGLSMGHPKYRCHTHIYHRKCWNYSVFHIIMQ